MDRDFQDTQRSRSASTDGVPQSSSAATVNQDDEALLVQLAAMSGLLELPVGESSFHASNPLTQGYALQHLPSSSHLYEQPIPGPSSQPNLSSFPLASHLPQSYQDLFSNLLSTSAAGPSHPISATNSPAASPDTTEPEIVDDERAGTEEKRRRNTEASSRFRIKKKQRTINLERSVSDLTGRADELEREVADLRRENDWLKEIVMLKSTRLAVLNQHLQAMNQNLVNEIPEKSRSRPLDSGIEEESSEDEEDEVEAASNKKGKGKSKSKRS